MGLYHKSQRRVCFKKGEDISVVKNKKRGSIEIHKELVEKEVYSTIEVTTDITSILYTKEEWKEEDGIELQISEELDNQKQLSIATDLRFNR